MIDDWAAEIVKGVLIQQRIEEVDSEGLWERHLPAVAASEDELAATERSLGHAIDPRYRSFLRYANGWRCFYQHVDLFGTPNLLGAPPMGDAVTMLDAVDDDDFVAALGMNRSDVMPIAASDSQPDMFLIGQPWSQAPGTVFWYTGQLIDRFPGFDDFFLGMLDNNRAELRDLEAQE